MIVHGPEKDIFIPDEKLFIQTVGDRASLRGLSRLAAVFVAILAGLFWLISG